VKAQGIHRRNPSGVGARQLFLCYWRDHKDIQPSGRHQSNSTNSLPFDPATTKQYRVPQDTEEPFGELGKAPRSARITFGFELSDDGILEPRTTFARGGGTALDQQMIYSSGQTGAPVCFENTSTAGNNVPNFSGHVDGWPRVEGTGCNESPLSDICQH
jgi:hypothetical protein